MNGENVIVVDHSLRLQQLQQYKIRNIQLQLQQSETVVPQLGLGDILVKR